MENLLFEDEQITKENRSQDQDDQPAQQTQTYDLLREIAQAFREVAMHNVLPVSLRKSCRRQQLDFGKKIKIASGYVMRIGASWYNDHKNDFLLWDDEINP
ncbi:26887_t:CDS:2, partial [Racocetra persica]